MSGKRPLHNPWVGQAASLLIGSGVSRFRSLSSYFYTRGLRKNLDMAERPHQCCRGIEGGNGGNGGKYQRGAACDCSEQCNNQLDRGGCQ